QAEQQIGLLLSRAPAGQQTRLHQLADRFNLSPFELDVLLVVMAPAFDLRYERLYGYLLDDATRKRPSVNLVLDLLCNPDPQRLLMLPYFQAEAPLFKLGFIEMVNEPGMVTPPLLNRALVPDPALVSWLLGQYVPHQALQPHVTLMDSRDGSADYLVAAPQLAALATTQEEEPLLAFHGADLEAQRAAARLLAQQIEAPLLHIRLDRLGESNRELAQSLRLALRDARLLGALPLLTGWDSCLQKGAAPADLLQQLCDFPGMAILSGAQKWQARDIPRERALIWLDFEMPDYAQRRRLWSHYLAEAPAGLALDKLAGQFLLSTGQIRDVARTARDYATRFGRPLDDDDLFIAAREHSSPKLGDLARKITPRYTWSDLVLPRDPVAILQEIVNTVLGRPRVLEEWGAGKKLAYSGVTV
ncbi:MAG: hypothetical protein KDE28_29240, partial [Anaerolineales bacterium]|nr:hypothetical protein [Anaerolineales bacterium]